MMLRAGYCDTSIGQLHWRQAGPWPSRSLPLLLLHPAPRSSRVFRRLMPHLAERGLSVLAVDLPGFGESCELPAASSMADIAGHVLECLDGLGIGQAHVFGLHSGNKVAAALVARWPARAASFAMAGMTHSIILDADRRNEAMRLYVQNKPPDDPTADPDAHRDLQTDRLLCRGYDGLYQANYAFDFGAALEDITVPSLVLELAVPAEESLGRQAKLICSRMVNACWQSLPMNDTDLLQRHPDQLAQALDGFIHRG